ncbi:MAG: phosphatidylglycerol lysyltransferase domain-containing protein [Candidatus Omnitrophica bacterium]|nr:phosphatidylglycerol lysyltransferase domain-containing protein [Candidatus Omnitrophota bacterium]
MGLKRLTLKEKNLFSYYLNLKQHQLSVYSFLNIYIWKKLFNIYWLVFKDSLFVFFQDSMGCFMYLPPLGKKINPKLIKEAFNIMDSFNKNKLICRIENVEGKDLDFYKELGYRYFIKSEDYLCKRSELVELKGSRFKAKRACFNYFLRNYHFKYLPFNLEYKDSCFKLYQEWLFQRESKPQAPLYNAMLKDMRSCLEVLLEDYLSLDVVGRIVLVEGVLKGVSFGFALNKETFCILYELTDLSIKGLAQFIFRMFCSELNSYYYINMMDDSGIKNLKETKLSYRPVRLIPNYTIIREYA